MSPRKLPGSSSPARKKNQLWGDRLNEPPEMRNVAYCAGRDVAIRPMADALLVPFDVWQNRAHVVMLRDRRIITPATARRLGEALREYESLTTSGMLQLDPRKEDVHTNIEHFIADRAGTEVSGTIHTARSRNDQSATVVRMFVRDRLLALATDVTSLVGSILDAAGKNLRVPIAGMTHYQPASITTLGHWFASYAQALLRDLERMISSYDRLNISPLGAAASFGTSWPIDRNQTARLMGFDGVQANSLDCITNRWEMEADAASSVSFLFAHLSMLSQDLILLSMPQIGILRIADRFVTGSSIMPQKRNPDFAEVTRAKAMVIQQSAGALFGIARGLPSGYNRDTQWTKYVIMDVFAEASGAAPVLSGVFDTLKVDRDGAKKTTEAHFVDAVDIADLLAQECNLPFRTAYNLVSRAVKQSEGRGSIDMEVVAALAQEAGLRSVPARIAQADSIVARKNHTGGPAPAAVEKSLKAMRRTLGEFSKDLHDRHKRLEAALANLRAAETSKTVINKDR